MVQDSFFNLDEKPKKEKGEPERGEWTVRSWTNGIDEYTITRVGGKWTCTCPFFVGRQTACKHIQWKKESLGLVKPDMSGMKSAVQKALRRNKIDLLRLSFTTLWEKEPKWLLWRLPILAAEETWQYMGLAGRYSFGEEATRENVWKLLWNIATHPKCKEAEGLNIMADKIVAHEEDPKVMIRDETRLSIFNGWMSIKKQLELMETDPETFWGWFNAGENEFAWEIVRTARRRSKFGGGGGDKTLLLVAAYLACVTKVEPIELEEPPVEADVVPVTEVPWYCWDMHTSIGKIVYYGMKKQLGEDFGEYVAMELWFNLGSAWCDALVEDSYWWNTCIEAWARRRQKRLDECKDDFRKWIPMIKERVVKILTAKRRNGLPGELQPGVVKRL